MKVLDVVLVETYVQSVSAAKAKKITEERLYIRGIGRNERMSQDAVKRNGILPELLIRGGGEGLHTFWFVLA